jgi:feruloyl esterase
VLLCKGAENNECLTRAQVASLETIQKGPQAPGTGQALYFGFEPTSAAVADNWERWLLNTDPHADSQLTFAEQFYRHLVFRADEWNVNRFAGVHDFTLANETTSAGKSLAQLLDATDPDLGALEHQGGKLLMYFGWADAVLAPRAAIDYYEKVGRRFGGIVNTQRFFRLFMVPGMTHCQGGPAPDAFGQSSVSVPLRDDLQHNIRRALEAWVERGTVPQSLVAAKYVKGNTALGVEATQLLCPFPQHAVMRDPADPKRASNYVCSDDNRQ